MKKISHLVIGLVALLSVFIGINLYLQSSTPSPSPVEQTAVQDDVSAADHALEAEEAYSLYQRALHLKQEKQFDDARDSLQRALTLIDNQQDAYGVIRDERYMHLPVAEATERIKQHRMDDARALVDEMEDYIAQVDDLPARYEYARIVDSLKSSLGYMQVALEVQYQQIEKRFNLALQTQRAEWGHYPEDQDQFEQRLLPVLGLEADYEFLSYERDGETAWAEFRDIEQDRVFTVEAQLR